MFSAAVSASKLRLFPTTETGKRKSRDRPCPRGLRLKTKKPAAVVDFAGLLKWGGGAYRCENPPQIRCLRRSKTDRYRPLHRLFQVQMPKNGKSLAAINRMIPLGFTERNHIFTILSYMQKSNYARQKNKCLSIAQC